MLLLERRNIFRFITEKLKSSCQRTLPLPLRIFLKEELNSPSVYIIIIYNYGIAVTRAIRRDRKEKKEEMSGVIGIFLLIFRIFSDVFCARLRDTGF